MLPLYPAVGIYLTRRACACSGFPPIAMIVDLTSYVVGYLPVTLAVLGLALMGYMLVKHRAFVAKAVGTVVRKVVRLR